MGYPSMPEERKFPQPATSQSITLRINTDSSSNMVTSACATWRRTAQGRSL